METFQLKWSIIGLEKVNENIYKETTWKTNSIPKPTISCIEFQLTSNFYFCLIKKVFEYTFYIRYSVLTQRNDDHSKNKV